MLGHPPNQSFERTGLGARGSLRSVGVILARRSTQIRYAARRRRAVWQLALIGGLLSCAKSPQQVSEAQALVALRHMCPSFKTFVAREVKSSEAAEVFEVTLEKEDAHSSETFRTALVFNIDGRQWRLIKAYRGKCAEYLAI